MLVKLSSEQIGKYWELIKIGLKVSSHPLMATNEEKLVNIQRALIKGNALCWMEGDKHSPRTMVITSVVEEELSMTRNLLIHCAHGFRKADADGYKKMVEVLGKYAKISGCINVICYVWNPRIVQLFKKYGADARYTLVVMPVS
jgi:hypothetical protein